MKSARHRKKTNSKILITFCIAVLVLVLGIVSYAILNAYKDGLKDNGRNKSQISSLTESSDSSVVSNVESKSEESSEKEESSVSSKEVSSKEVSSKEVSSEEVVSTEESSSVEDVSSEAEVSSESETSEKTVKNNSKKLDPEYSRLLLVNGENPLPENYDYEGNLATIEGKYLCGYRNQMDKNVLPYAIAMVEAAWEDNVELYILSPYRSYSTQEVLYNNEVAEWKAKGDSQKEAENNAATEVARPGTSEHHTGLAIDFNSVSTSFENTEAFKWMEKNAADYGFIMRYPKDKQNITGVIYEPWHWRFVGIKHAKEIKKLGITLEEYV